MEMKTRIVREESTRWNSYGENKGCVTEVHYKMQYRKSFLGFKYWKNFTELICGMGNCMESTIWMKDKKALINRFNCAMNKTKYTFENE